MRVTTEMSLKNTSKCIKNQAQNAFKIALNSHPNFHRCFHRVLPPKIVQNASKKGGQNLRKFGFGRLGGHWDPQGAPEATNLAKMEPKGSPRLPKCCPGDTQKWKNGDQGIPRALKVQPRRRQTLPKWNPRDSLSFRNEHRGIHGL